MNKMSVEDIQRYLNSQAFEGVIGEVVKKLCRTALTLYEENEKLKSAPGILTGLAMVDTIFKQEKELIAFRIENKRLKDIETKYNSEVHVTYGDERVEGIVSIEDLKLENKRLKREGELDYKGMRDMQFKFMKADHKLREIKDEIENYIEGEVNEY